MTNNIELHSILYYADFLSLRETSTPVTDNCKYFFIYGAPINSAYLANTEPIYDINNKYYIQAYTEYNTIKTKFGDEGIESFIEQICSLRACGCVDAKRMLLCIHQYNNKSDRKSAFKKYEKWLSNQKYETLTINEEEKEEYVECSKYIAHQTKKERIRYSNRTN